MTWINRHYSRNIDESERRPTDRSLSEECSGFFAHDIEIKTTPPTDAALHPASTAVRGTIATEAVGSVAAMSAAASSASSVGGENFLVGPIELSIASIVLHLVGVVAAQASAGPKCPIWARRILQCLVGNFVGEDFLFILVEVARVVIHGLGPSQKKLRLDGSRQKSKGVFHI